MTRRKRLPKSICKYIRQEKARLRRKVSDIGEQKKKIEELYKRFGGIKECLYLDGEGGSLAKEYQRDGNICMKHAVWEYTQR